MCRRPGQSHPWWPPLPPCGGLKLRSSLIDEWRQESNVSRDRGLVHIEDLRPHLLGDVVAHISTGDDECLAQGEFPRTTFALIPRIPGEVRRPTVPAH
jgi:hypothetical protein